MWFVSFFFGVFVFVYMGFWFLDRGFSFDLNIVNWFFLILGLLFVCLFGYYIEFVMEGGKFLGLLFF